MYGLPCFLVICLCLVCLFMSSSSCWMFMVFGCDCPVMVCGVLKPFLPK